MAIIKSRNHKIKNKIIEVRSAIPKDAIQIIELQKKLTTETKFMIKEPYEIVREVSVHENKLKSISEDNNSIFIVALIKNQIVGYLVMFSKNLERIKHVGSFIVGVEKKYWGIGIASLLIEEMLLWAKTVELKRIELEVVEDNIRAIELYKKYEFKIEGKKLKDHYIGEGKYLNTLVMGKII
ncbi:acetyltransferase, ribosomal protein N-acetylase [Gottschalkia purinilytica]|uniref:Acetyltransferase, ribosomal protein N-acetylase n=1 Tax=Gottschalkia purinilytica TaxID=1503 RepID=A0A0L0WF94_GOTPU|nr:GNAT family N-acetyltransferase [Gottschalkia purinilytica]KNF10090.1 acetyltransferase, ribosomal protein N-acetylase [Gottschalkia purinilytica]